MPTYDNVEYERTTGAAWIRLDRPEVLNALNEGLLADLEAALAAAEADDDVRVAVLAGNGRAFSAGYDIGDAEGDLGTIEDRLMSARTHLDTIFELQKPVVAAVDGPALAGGCNLAIAPDLTYASERSEFGYPDMHFGELPAKFVLPFVGNSLKYARELLYTGKTVPAEAAARMGLVNRVVPAAELETVVAEEVDHIRKTPGAVVALLKDMVNEVQEAQGDRRGRVDEALASLTMEGAAPQRFREIREAEGFGAALEWMHETDKD